MSYGLHLTVRQSDRMVEVLGLYADYVKDTKRELYIGLKVVLTMIDQGAVLQQDELDLIEAVLEDWCGNMDPTEWDEDLEISFFKLFGRWPIEPPYFSKRDNLPWPIPGWR